MMTTLPASKPKVYKRFLSVVEAAVFKRDAWPAKHLFGVFEI